MVLGKRLLFETCVNCGKKIQDDEKGVLVDNLNDLVFCSDACVQEYFSEEIEQLETEHLSLRAPTDIPIAEFSKYEQYLLPLLNDPDEVWQLDERFDGSNISFVIGEFLHENTQIFYVAACYLSEGKPTFVYLHFPTRDTALIEKYRRGVMVFDSEEEQGLKGAGLEDDEMDEDNVAIEIYQEMLENRSQADIDPDDFASYNEYKLPTVEKPEEVWRRIDDSGNVFLVYLAHFQKEAETFAYVVVAYEDEITESAHPIFGFPTVDQQLLERFRTGEPVFRADGNEPTGGEGFE